MSWSASIRVVDNEGDPVSGAKVAINFGIFNGFDNQYTNDDGWAEFSYDTIEDSRMSVIDIWINSVRVGGDFNLEDGDTESYTIPD